MRSGAIRNSILCKYRIKVSETLTTLELAKIFNESAAFLIKTFNGFEKKQFGDIHEIEHETVESLSKGEYMANLVEWFYLK